MSDHTLYLDYNTHDVYLEPGSYGYESFTPTVDFTLGDQGFLVVVKNVQYDSNGTNGTDYVIVDAYKQWDQAREVAQAIVDHNNAVRDYEYSWNRKKSQQEPTLTIIMANGEPYLRANRLPWIGWGNRLDEVLVIRFRVEQTPKVMVFH